MVSPHGQLLYAILWLTAMVSIASIWNESVTRDICSCSTHSSGGGDVQILKHCLDQHPYRQVNSKVAIVSYASPGTREFAISDIEQFSVYQAALLTAYAERRQYTFRQLNSTVGMDLGNTTDSRWYKIKILEEALRPGGWAEHVDYIVWIDADAIVLDLGLRVEALGARYPAAHLLASADIRMGLLNTGVLVLRNSAWTRTFLHEWWSGPPGAQNWRGQCDQDAFDGLYAHYLRREQQEDGSSAAGDAGGIGSKVRVLPMRALNSHPPAVVHQWPADPVLHLMGESTALRRAAFRRAWVHGVCAAAASEGVQLPAQLGLHREALQDISKEVYGADVQTLLAAASAPLDSSLLRSLVEDITVGQADWAAAEADLEGALLTPLVALSSTAHHYCDLLRQLSAQQSSPSARKRLTAEETELRQRILQLVLARIEQFRQAAAQMFADLPAEEHGGAQAAQARRLLTSVLAQLLKRAAEAGNDVFGTARSTADKLAAAQQVLAMLEELLQLVDDASRHVPLHMQALMHQNLGAMENGLAASATSGSATSVHKDLATAHLESAYRHLRSSVAAFDQRRENLRAQAGLAEDRSALLEESMSLQLLAGVTCGLGKLREGVRRWEQAVAQARSSLLGIELGVRYANLAAVLYNAAVCHVAAARAPQAQLLATEAAGILEDMARQGAEDEQHRALGAHIDTLLAQISAAKSEIPVVPSEPEVAGVVRVAARAAAAGFSVGDGKVTYVSATQGVHTSGQKEGESKEGEEEEEEEEWVECELDEPCDVYEVVESAPPAAALASAEAPAQVGGTGAAEGGEELDVLAGLDVQGMSAEEVEELREVRARYFRQAGKTAATERGASSAQKQESTSVGAAQDGTHTSTGPGAGDTQQQLAEALGALQRQVAGQGAAQEALLALVRQLGAEVKQLREELRRRDASV